MRAIALGIVLLVSDPAGYAWPVAGVVDGDTLQVRLPGLPGELQPVSVRVRGVDTPETGGRARCEAERRDGARATAFTEAMLRSGSVRFVDPEWDKYGRVLATVTVAGEDLAAALIRAGRGRPYDGGKRGGWCD